MTELTDADYAAQREMLGVIGRPHATVGSIFAGIGGWDIGLTQAGWTVTWQVECDADRRAVLALGWPSATRVDFVDEAPDHVPPVDLVVAACQRQTFADGDPVYDALIRTIAAAGPRYVVVETTRTAFDCPEHAAWLFAALDALHYDAFRMPVAYGRALPSGARLQWERDFVIGLSRPGGAGSARWLRRLCDSRFMSHFAESDTEATKHAHGNLGGDTGSDPDETTLLASVREVEDAFGFPSDWTAPIGAVAARARALIATTAVPVAFTVGAALLRPDWWWDRRLP